jgi:flagellar hook-associated protein 2
MGEISFGGLATGLPTEELITGLMAIERRPLERLEKQKTSESDRLRAFAEFKSKLDDLRSAVGSLNITSAVRTSSVRVSAEAAFSATSNGAAPGSFDVAVAQLAQVQKTVSGGFASETATLGTGTVTFGTETITLDESNNSLQGLAAAINERAGKTGVQASIIHDGGSGTPYRLVLTGRDAQSSFTPVVELENAEGQAVNLGLNELRSAQQAIVYVDSIKVVSNSNTLSGVIPGLTLNLSEVSDKTSQGTPEEGVDPADWADPPQYKTNLLTVEADTEALKGKIQTFVDKYNAVMDWISSGYVEFGAPVSSVKKEGEEAVDSLALLVRGDSSINAAKRNLQSILGSAVNNSGTLSTLSQLGISTQRDGSLNLNTAKLDTQLTENFDDIAKLLAGDDTTEGVMKKFNTTLLQMTSNSSGMYAGKKDRHDSVVKRLNQQIFNTEALLQKKEGTMRARFTAMELLVSGMNSQSTFLTQQMDMLNNMMTGNR